MKVYIAFNKKSDRAEIVLKNCNEIYERLEAYEEHVSWFAGSKVKKMVFSAFDYEPFKDEIKRYSIKDTYKVKDYVNVFAIRVKSFGCEVFVKDSKEDSWNEYKETRVENCLELEYETYPSEGLNKVLYNMEECLKTIEVAKRENCEYVSSMLNNKYASLKNELNAYEEAEEIRREKIKKIWE